MESKSDNPFQFFFRHWSSPWLGLLFCVHLVIVGYSIPSMSSSWMLLLPLGFLIFGIFGLETGAHRYLAHQSFSTSGFLDFVLAYLANLVFIGTARLFCIEHIKNSHPELIIRNKGLTSELAENLRKHSPASRIHAPVLAVLTYFLLVLFDFQPVLMMISSGFVSGIILSPLLYSLTDHRLYPSSWFFNLSNDTFDKVACLIKPILRTTSNHKVLFLKIPQLNSAIGALENHFRQLDSSPVKYFNENHSDIYCDWPQTLEDCFSNKFWDDCGFAVTHGGKYVPPHEDMGLAGHESVLSVKTGRTCSIFFPLKNSMSSAPVKLYGHNMEYLDEVVVDAPTLIQTGRPVFHEIDNRNEDERKFFCLNFYEPKQIDDVVLWLKNENKLS